MLPSACSVAPIKQPDTFFIDFNKALNTNDHARKLCSTTVRLSKDKIAH